MKQNVKIIRLFIASPSDVSVEKIIIHESIEDINRSFGRSKRFRIDVLDWKNDAYPDVGADAQNVINNQIGEYDIFLE